MPLDTKSKIDIPESIEGYKVTLFWNLTIKQVILVFIATLLVGFAVFCLASHRPIAATALALLAILSLLAMVELRGRNFYRHVWFIIFYYMTKPQVLIYHHYASSGTTAFGQKQLIYQKQSNTKIFIIIFIALGLGLVLLGLVGEYIYHVIHH